MKDVLKLVVAIGIVSLAVTLGVIAAKNTRQYNDRVDTCVVNEYEATTVKSTHEIYTYCRAKARLNKNGL